MATVSQVTKVLTNCFGREEAQVKQIARRLLDAGALPKAKGRRIPDLALGQIVLFSIAVLVTEKITDTWDECSQWAGLTHGGVRPGMPFILSYLDIFTSIGQGRHTIFDDGVELWYDELQIEFMLDPCTVKIKHVPYQGQSSVLMVFANSELEAKMWMSNRPRKSYTVPGAAINCIMQGINIFDNRNVLLETNESNLSSRDENPPSAE